MPTDGLMAFDKVATASKICNFIRRRAGRRLAVIGLSGGIDSAVTAELTVRALGKERVLAVVMPDWSATPREDADDAISLAEEMKVRCKVVDITDVSRSLVELASAGEIKRDQVAEGNVRARLRMTILYYFANSQGGIVVGSGDRSELLIGYFTKYGDGGVDLLPLGCLYKTQVRELARWLGIPRRIIEKRSSPRLWQGQTAEGELGLSYEEIDNILFRLIDLKMSGDEIAREMGSEYAKKAEIVARMVRESAHKRRMPPIPNI